MNPGFFIETWIEMHWTELKRNDMTCIHEFQGWHLDPQIAKLHCRLVESMWDMWARVFALLQWAFRHCQPHVECIDQESMAVPTSLFGPMGDAYFRDQSPCCRLHLWSSWAAICAASWATCIDSHGHSSILKRYNICSISTVILWVEVLAKVLCDYHRAQVLPRGNWKSNSDHRGK